jgi:hypothetical protein
VDTEVALENGNGVASWPAPDTQAALVWAKYSGFYQPAAEIPSPHADTLSSFPEMLDF